MRGWGRRVRRGGGEGGWYEGVGKEGGYEGMGKEGEKRGWGVTFELNVRLDLSGKATTKSLSSLGTELVL